MSVIHDALRRRKHVPSADSPTPPSSTRLAPAGLGLTSGTLSVSRGRGRQIRLVASVAVVLLLAVWGLLRLMSEGAITPSDAPAVAAQLNSAPQSMEPEPATPQTTPDPAEATQDAGPAGPRTPPGTRRRALRRATNLESRVQSPAHPVPNPGSRIPSPESPVPDPGSRVPARDHFELALRYQKLGNLDRAREHYLAVLAEDEFHVEARNNLGLLYHSRGMTNEAVDAFRRVIALNPRYIKARSNLAVVLTDARRLPEARAELRAALAIEPRNSDVLVNLALVDKADSHAEQAIELLVRAVGVSPQHAVAHYNLAALYEERDSLALAFDHYNAFLKHAGPEHGSLLTDVQRRLGLIEPKLQKATN